MRSTAETNWKVDISLPKADPAKSRRKRMKKLEADMLALMRETGKDDAFKEKMDNHGPRVLPRAAKIRGQIPGGCAGRKP